METVETTKEMNLNEELNSEDNSTEPVVENQMNTVTQEVAFVNVFDYVTKHKDKVQNASILDFSKLPAMIPGKYILFKTKHETDSDLVLIEESRKLWVKDQEPTEIVVKNSGIIIKSKNARTYVSKNNVVHVILSENGSTEKICFYGKAKDKDSVKTEVSTEARVEYSIDNVKLYIKKLSPRLSTKVKDVTEKDALVAAIMNYMLNIQDINHLIKIEEQLIYTCSI
jgi:hypothetical protein